MRLGSVMDQVGGSGPEADTPLRESEVTPEASEQPMPCMGRGGRRGCNGTEKRYLGMQEGARWAVPTAHARGGEKARAHATLSLTCQSQGLRLCPCNPAPHLPVTGAEAVVPVGVQLRMHGDEISFQLVPDLGEVHGRGKVCGAEAAQHDRQQPEAWSRGR